MFPKNLTYLRIFIIYIIFSFSEVPVASGQGDPVVLGGNGASTVNVTSSDGDGTPTINGTGMIPNMSASSRFLGQATLGADFETISSMTTQSYNQWIDEQFATARAFDIENRVMDITLTVLDSVYANNGDPNQVQPQLAYWYSAWWEYILTSPDILRSKVALALSEIFVISEIPNLAGESLALANYYDMLLNNSFGNFRDLLEDVTLHPAMGIYLTHINNPRSDSTINRFPDENYAREIMQLLTIGLYELNIDGTRKLDTAGNFIPTYDNDDIREFAKVFTGMTFDDNFLFGQDPLSHASFLMPMKMVDYWHEPGPKYLLNGDTIPDRNPVDGVADLNDALDNLFYHPNVGPFIAYRLIQRLVRANPSPEYIERVAAAFNNNGIGVRGDMQAVIKAILLDPEARDCSYANDPFEGMLREPLVRYTQICRAFNAYTPSGVYRNIMAQFYELTGQKPLASPSVFNFFQPDYQPIGPIEQNDLVAPVYQLTNTTTVLGYANRLHDWIYKDYNIMEYISFYEGESFSVDKLTSLDFSDEMSLEEFSEIGELIERLNIILVHGQMTPETRAIITKTIKEIPDNRAQFRVQTAIFLVLLSPDYLILK